MNRLLTEFNDTVGREKGILLNVTNMTNSAAIGGQLRTPSRQARRAACRTAAISASFRGRQRSGH
ncbi:MAG: hypothetical protein ACLVJH_06895 [Faecalibacterium prausnitzii]